MSEQIPPADELAQVRAEIASLQDREKELRLLMLTDKSARTGNRWAVEIVAVTSDRVDIKELRKMHGDLVAEYTFPHTIEKVELRLITDDGELVRAPKRERT